MVTGYQFSSTDGSNSFHFKVKNINGPYIDGVSITYGSPRKHVWTYISSLSETLRPDCPCMRGAGSQDLHHSLEEIITVNLDFRQDTIYI